MNMQNAWNMLCKRVHAPNSILCAYEDIVLRYAESARKYHTLDHVRWCLIELARAEKITSGTYCEDFALWLHDVVYDPRRSDNEEQSALYAEELLAPLGGTYAQEVSKLIRATKSHQGSGLMESLVIDIDMSILGAPKDEFLLYEKSIRKEYEWVPNSTYQKVRISYLEEWLSWEQIFKTEFFFARYEKAARDNVASLLKILSQKN